MNRLKRSPLHGSVFALAVSAVALLLTVLLRPYLEPNIFVLFVVAAWVSAWLYGRTGGLVATAASAVAILYFFLRPDPAVTDARVERAAPPDRVRRHRRARSPG